MEFSNTQAHTYGIHTHTRAHKKKEVERLEKEGKKSRKINFKKKRGGQESKKEEKKKGRKERGGKEGGTLEEKVGRGEKKERKKKKEGGGWVQGGRGAWVLRKAGPHTNNARST